MYNGFFKRDNMIQRFDKVATVQLNSFNIVLITVLTADLKVNSLVGCNEFTHNIQIQVSSYKLRLSDCTCMPCILLFNIFSANYNYKLF